MYHIKIFFPGVNFRQMAEIFTPEYFKVYLALFQILQIPVESMQLTPCPDIISTKLESSIGRHSAEKMGSVSYLAKAESFDPECLSQFQNVVFKNI